MKRKVVKHGPSTLIVSLPSQWTKEYQVEKGDELEVQEHPEGYLTVSTDGTVSAGGKTIQADGFDLLLRRTVVRLYEEGYSTITVEFSDPSTLAVVQKIIPQLIGFEIIEHGKGKAVIQDIAGTSDENLMQLLRKLFRLLEQMFIDGKQALKEKDQALIDQLIQRDAEVNKLAHYCNRVLYMRGSSKRSDLPLYTQLISGLEKVGDGLKVYLRDGVTPVSGTLALLRAVHAFTFNCTKEQAIKVAEQYESLNSTDEIVQSLIRIHELQLSRITDL